MKSLQITLFLIANVIFISQASRHVHQLVFGTQPSVFDQFSPEKEKAKSEEKLEVLLAQYRPVYEQVTALEKGRTYEEIRDIQSKNDDLYEKKRALQSELTEREQKGREMRDTWLFSGFGLLLIITGGVLYSRVAMWTGFALVVTGFCILEYWASPSFFGGGALSEFHQLLVAKTILTLTALVLLHVFWAFRQSGNNGHPRTTPGLGNED